jgi:hypothetical protein
MAKNGNGNLKKKTQIIFFLFCQHNSTGGGNLELKQTI